VEQEQPFWRSSSSAYQRHVMPEIKEILVQKAEFEIKDILTQNEFLCP